MEYKFSYFCAQGIREYNQDACFVDKNKYNQVFGIVCDGVGSEKHSEVASTTMVGTCAYHFANEEKINFLDFYNKCLDESYREIGTTMSREYRGASSSTTVVCTLITDDIANISWIGDSRVYYFSSKKNEWEQISEDQNLFYYLMHKWNKIKQRMLDNPSHTDEDLETYEEMKNKEFEKNQFQLTAITHALENTSLSYKEYQTKDITVSSGDYILLCTDGVYNWTSTDEFSELIKLNGYNAAKSIVERALSNKSNDNSTCVVIQIK